MSGRTKNSDMKPTLLWYDPDDLKIQTDGDLVDYRAGLPIPEPFVRDIQLRGVVVPVVVAMEDGRPWVVDGQQRVKAASEANRRNRAKGDPAVRVPCVLRAGDKAGLYAAGLAANCHRQEDDPLTRARQLERALSLGADEEEIAIACGVGVRTIRNWLEMLTLGPAAREALKDGRLSPTAALPLARLPITKQAEAVAGLKKHDGKRATVREAQAATRGERPRRRMRGKAEIELVMFHHPSALREMNGVTVLRWVLGSLELEELSVPETAGRKGTATTGTDSEQAAGEAAAQGTGAANAAAQEG